MHEYFLMLPFDMLQSATEVISLNSTVHLNEAQNWQAELLGDVCDWLWCLGKHRAALCQQLRALWPSLQHLAAASQLLMREKFEELIPL